MYAYEMLPAQRTTLMLCLLRRLPGDRLLCAHVARYATDDMLLPRLLVVHYAGEYMYVCAPCGWMLTRGNYTEDREAVRNPQQHYILRTRGLEYRRHLKLPLKAVVPCNIL